MITELEEMYLRDLQLDRIGNNFQRLSEELNSLIQSTNPNIESEVEND